MSVSFIHDVRLRLPLSGRLFNECECIWIFS